MILYKKLQFIIIVSGRMNNTPVHFGQQQLYTFFYFHIIL